MARGRQPKSKAAQEATAPAILRTVRLGDDLYGEGEEEELLEAMDKVEEEDRKARKEKPETPGTPFSKDDELHRLTRLGFLANFVELSQEEVDDMDPDLRANTTYRRALQAVPEGGVVENEPGRRDLSVGVGRQARTRSRAEAAMVEEARPKAGARRRARRGPTQEKNETAEDPEE